MEVPGGYNNKTFVMMSEILGTMFVMIAVNWGATSDATPQCVGLMVFMLIQIFGQVSGGHFNPAVTLAVLFKEGSANWMRNFTFTIMIFIWQAIGGALGCAVCSMGFKWEKNSDAKKLTEAGYHVAQLCPSGGCNDGGDLIVKVLFCETVCTFLFVSFILMVTKYNGSPDMPINALAIGIALYFSITMASGISGGCINPAVGLY